MSHVSTPETVWGFSGKEDFWIIVAIRSEDETEIRAAESGGRRHDRDIRRARRRQYGGGDDPHLQDGLRGEESIAELCRKEGIAQSMYYRWSKEFLKAGKQRLAGDTALEATANEVKALRAEVVSQFENRRHRTK